MGMTVIMVNGKTIRIEGDDIVVTKNSIIVDGKVIEGEASGIVEVQIVGGEIGNIQTNVSITCTGLVKGDIKAGGSVSCNNVEGNVAAGGSVSAFRIGGSVNAGGSVKYNQRG